MSVSLGPDLLSAAAAHDPGTVELRRSIHNDPELGLELPRTQAKVLDALEGLGLTITTGEALNSVVADLDTGRSGPTVLLRGDMDALPLQEDADVDYASAVDGVMHACGHDAHTAMLLSAARLLSENKSELSGRVRFMFQPGEEGHHGAKIMIDEGVLDGVDRAFALHILTTLPDGVIHSRAGALMASADRFEITIDGEGGHASAPHQCVDPIPAAAATVTGLHTMVGRSLDPTASGLVTVGHIRAGTTNNIIPPTAFMEGTIRALDEETRSTLHDGVHRVANNTAAAHGCSCTSTVVPGYPVTVNNDDEALHALGMAAAVGGADRAVEMPRPILGAEDWSYVLQQVPGSMAFLGVCPPELDPSQAAPNHSNLMRISEANLSIGVAVYAAMAMSGPTV